MTDTQPDTAKLLFMHLVSMLAMTAMQQMGKLIDPATGKAEPHLDAAQATIDMLDMLSAKTRGNLNPEEARLLKDTLMSLQMNYVQTRESLAAQKAPASGTSATAEPERPEAKPKAEPGTESDTGASAPPEEKKPRYHKTFGN